jgi:hypothetical protein
MGIILIILAMVSFLVIEDHIYEMSLDKIIEDDRKLLHKWLTEGTDKKTKRTKGLKQNKH